MDELRKKKILFGDTFETCHTDDVNHEYVRINWDENMNLFYNVVHHFANLSPRVTTRLEVTLVRW